MSEKPRREGRGSDIFREAGKSVEQFDPRVISSLLMSDYPDVTELMADQQQQQQQQQVAKRGGISPGEAERTGRQQS